jgi:hypothetical protein
MSVPTAITWCHEISVQPGVIVAADDGFIGGLIHAAFGSAGGFGKRPLKRMGLAANAASRVTARSAVIAAAVP